MSTVSTHILDAAMGRPAAGVAVALQDSSGEVLGEATTNGDGRVASLTATPLAAGRYELVFATGTYFDTSGVDSFYPEVRITFAIRDETQHYHVPLLLSPFAYSTYRGS